MKTKSLKKLTEMLSKNEGISIAPIIVIMVIMSIMGGVFTSIMGGWKVSAPLTVNTNKAFYQAEMAAMFALEDAQFRFTEGTFDYGTSLANPVVVSSVTTSNVTEVAEYWVERPELLYYDDDNTTGTNTDYLDDDLDDTADVIPPGGDGWIDTDLNHDGVSNRYTIIATGKVKIGGNVVAKRQIKILADIEKTDIPAGVNTSGAIIGMGVETNGFGIVYNAFTTWFVTGTNLDKPDDSANDIVFRPAVPADPTTFKGIVQTIATAQLHNIVGNLSISLASTNDDYPEPLTPSFYYDSPLDTVPNFSYIDGNLTVDTFGYKAHGVIWVTGDVTLTDSGTMEAIIICEGNITFSGSQSNINGGIIHYGATITGNQNTTASIIVHDPYFVDLNTYLTSIGSPIEVPKITVVSWQDARSAN